MRLVGVHDTQPGIEPNDPRSQDGGGLERSVQVVQDRISWVGR
jgi:hypothetical protein